MKRWHVAGYVTFSAYAIVEAKTFEEAKQKFEALTAPGLCNQCSSAGAGTEESGEVTLNGSDDNTVALDAEEEKEG